MRIAILGWGSLLWDHRPDFDNWHGNWEYDGPTMKLEFSRVSESRLKALTLVIDEQGTPTATAWCLSKRATPEDAICDLRAREGTTLDNVGRANIASQSTPSNFGAAEGSIQAWARSKDLDVVIWTALGSNFREKTGQPFSVAAAISHLKNLPPEGKVKAAEYVWRAPGFVKTPVRSALQKETWFADLRNYPMDENDRKSTQDYINNLLALANASWRDFDTRRSYEWKFNLALWPALAVLTGALLKAELPGQLSTSERVLITAVFAVVFVLYVYPWTWKLRERNYENTSRAENYWRIVEHLIFKNHPPEKEWKVKPRKVWDEMPPVWKAWSHLTQIFVTFLLTMLAIWATWHASS